MLEWQDTALLGTVEVPKVMPGFLLSGPSGSPCGISHEMTIPVLTWASFYGWIGTVLFSPRSPYLSISTLCPCLYNYLFSLSWYSSFLKSMEISRCFHTGIEVYKKTLSYFQKSSLFPPRCPFTLYLNVQYFVSQSSWQRTQDVPLRTCVASQNFRGGHKHKEPWVSASRLISSTCISLVYVFP